MKKVFLSGITLFLCTCCCKAQSVGPSTFNASGGSGTIGANMYEWSVAEMTLVSTATTPNLIVTQGMLQPQDGPVSVKDISSIAKLVRVYPNPASHTLYLETSFTVSGELSYELHDIAGKSIIRAKKEINAGRNISEIHLSAMVDATYMLYVSYKDMRGSSQQISFKIDKIK